MQNLLSISFAIFAFNVKFSSADNLTSTEKACGPHSFFSHRPTTCEFRCTIDGIEFKCDSMEAPGCDCDFGYHMDLNTQLCSKIYCENMKCVGKKNEEFFECESSRRDRCECTSRITMDCMQGCMCRNGFCRNASGECVKRKCKHPVFN